jgi:hypothetical protein
MGVLVLVEIIQQLKACARNACPNGGIHQLAVIYINRTGWFCNDCKNELINDGLVLENKNTGFTRPSREPVPQPVISKGDQKSRTYYREN